MKNSNNIVNIGNNTKIDIMILSKCIIMTNHKIEINLDNIINKIFEKYTFKKIKGEFDGNCLYRCLSVNKLGKENNYINIRNLDYNYLYSNQHVIYKFCKFENNYLVVKFE